MDFVRSDFLQNPYFIHMNIIYFPEDFKLKDSLHLCFAHQSKLSAPRISSEFAKKIKWLLNCKGILMPSVNYEQKNTNEILNFAVRKADGSGIPLKKKPACQHDNSSVFECPIIKIWVRILVSNQTKPSAQSELNS